MARRRRYDTEALVGQMRVERRTAVILSLAGVFILGFLLTLYITGIGGDDEVPEIPPTASAATTPEDTGAESATDAAIGAGDSAGADVATGTPVETGAEAETASRAAPAAAPAKVNINLSKKGMLWVNGEKVGKVKGTDIALPPGSHVIKAKLGKNTVEAAIEVTGGESLTVSFHHKKKTAAISKAGGGDGDEPPKGKKKKRKKKKKR